jgi:hypothetical protein
MPPATLAPTLTNGITTGEWYKLINGKIFFWLCCEDLERFLDASEYRNSPQLAIVIDTARMVNRYAEKITLTRFNSGSTMADHPYPRGRETFRTIRDYDSPYARELCVDGGIAGILDVVITVHRMIANRNDYSAPRNVRELEQLWPRPD